MAGALEDTFTVQLGGAHGAAQGWGSALAVFLGANAQLSGLRSELGNRLARRGVERGLVGMGVVAYTEVRLVLPAPNDASGAAPAPLPLSSFSLQRGHHWHGCRCLH